jgi:hypothetical protein
VLSFLLTDVSRVEFYKRDELTTDLICCEATADGVVHFRHEEAPDWDQFVEELRKLPGFDGDWFAKVGKPAFAECRIVAFTRP